MLDDSAATGAAIIVGAKLSGETARVKDRGERSFTLKIVCAPGK